MDIYDPGLSLTPFGRRVVGWLGKALTIGGLLVVCSSDEPLVSVVGLMTLLAGALIVLRGREDA